MLFHWLGDARYRNWVAAGNKRSDWLLYFTLVNDRRVNGTSNSQGLYFVKQDWKAVVGTCQILAVLKEVLRDTYPGILAFGFPAKNAASSRWSW